MNDILNISHDISNNGNFLAAEWQKVMRAVNITRSHDTEFPDFCAKNSVVVPSDGFVSVNMLYL